MSEARDKVANLAKILHLQSQNNVLSSRNTFGNLLTVYFVSYWNVKVLLGFGLMFWTYKHTSWC